MFELSKEIIDFLTSKIEVTDVTNDIYAVIAPENQVFPFITFVINQQAVNTRDGDQFNVTLFLWFNENQYKQAMQFTDTVTEVVKNKSNWSWENTYFEFLEENISYCGIINFKKQ